MTVSWRPQLVPVALMTLTLALIGANAIELLTGPGLGRDAFGYYIAAENLMAGRDLYFDDASPFGSEVFLFAPWFAVAWIPMTWLGPDAAITLWLLAMCAATVWAVRPFFSMGTTGTLLGCVLAYSLAWGALWANVMPLLVGVLIHSHGRRSFPARVGLAASLKVLPILYMWPYVVERRWWDVTRAVGVMVLLWTPAVFYGIASYPRGFSPTALSLLQFSAWLWGAVAVFAVLLTIRLRYTRYRWLVTTCAILAIYPRAHVHYIGLLGVGHAPNRHRSHVARQSPAGRSRGSSRQAPRKPPRRCRTW